MTQEQGLELFNSARPKLFDPISLPAWLAYMSEPTSPDWKPLSDTLMERAEKVFTSLDRGS